MTNVSLTEKQERYISDQLDGGDYQNASELVRDALRLHELYRKKVVEDLRAEISKGWDAPASDLSVLDILKQKQSV